MARMSFPPGFRFHATDIELIMYYLKRKVMGKKLHFDAVTELNIYMFSPWDLPDKCLLKSKDLEWYFFSPSEKKYGSGARTNRATETGYWKATGKDRPVIYNQRTVGMIKTLIFHEGHAPKGHRTDWVMHEYRLEDENLVDVVQDAYRLCKIFQKSGLGPKNGAQYGAPFKEEDWSDMEETCVESSSVSCQIFSDCVLPSNKNNSDAVSLMVPGNSAHRSTSEPDPSTDRPLDFNMQTGMKEICVESSSIDAHVSYNYVPPGHVQSSVAISTTVPGNSSVWCTSNSGLSKAGPPVMGMPSNPSVLLDEDFDALLGMFVEHINMPENKCNEKFENNGTLPFLNENGIYNELGDLNDWMELSETGFNILTTEWTELSETGFNILKTEDAAYNLNPLLLFDDTPFLELDDLSTPLRCHAETGEFKSMHTESTYAAHTYERSMGINVSYSDGDYLSSLENVSGWNDPSALLEESHLPGNSFK